MAASEINKITIEANVKASINKVWKLWTTPDDIIHWNNASADWYTPRAKNNLRTGGKFTFRMESKDGKSGFDFDGIYDRVKPKEFIPYTIGDGRKVEIKFFGDGTGTRVTETFEAESQNSVEMQRDGWQAILNNFKKYTESV